MKTLPLAILLLSLAASCQGSVVYVNKTAPGSVHDGKAWKTATLTVQEGLDVAKAGDEVWVAQGTYYESITLNSGIALYGGFNGTETAMEQRDAGANATILDGSFRKRVVTIPAGVGSATVLDGFTIQDGMDYDYTNTRPGEGGGVYIGGGTPVVSNNIITGNYTGGDRSLGADGGGIFVADGAPLIIGNTISNNVALYGGGIYAAGGTIQDNVIANNTAYEGYSGNGVGAGIVMRADVVVVHNMIVGNQQNGAYGEGGGIACNGGTITDSLFMGNDGFYGGAISAFGQPLISRNVFSTTMNYNDVQMGAGTFSDNLMVTRYPVSLTLASGQGADSEHNALVANNTFIHTGTQGGYAISSNYSGGETPVVSNNIIVGWKGAAQQYQFLPSGTLPTVTTDHNDVYGNASNTINLNGASQVGQNGNISADPLFVNAANGDFHLQPNSPCINAGNDAVVTAGDTDLDGRPRRLGSHVDIGAYEAVPVNAATFQQSLRALRIAAGLGIASSTDEAQLNVETAGASAGKVDMADALHLLRAAVGIGS